MAEVEVPQVLNLPNPESERERQIFFALIEQNRKITEALEKIVSLLP